MAYEPITPSYVPNTIMRKYINDNSGEVIALRIKPIDGYLLHLKDLDIPEYDETLMEETGVILRGYSAAERSCGVNYDWENTTVIDGYTAYGSREFFARPIDEVPENQIFGGRNNDHEVM
jgi:hypothetical protein